MGTTIHIQVEIFMPVFKLGCNCKGHITGNIKGGEVGEPEGQAYGRNRTSG